MIDGMTTRESATSRPTVVLTLGRLPVGLDIARSLAQEGWRVVVAEPFGMHLCRMSRAVHRSVRIARPDREPERYLEQLADVILRERAKLVIPVSEESPRIAQLRPRLPESVSIYADTPENMLALHDKFEFARLAADADLTVPETHLPGELRGPAPHDLVIKPRLSCSGRGVRFVAAGETIDARTGEVIQDRIHGEEYSGFCLSRAGEIAAPVVYRSAVSSGSVAVCFERVDDVPAIIDWMRRFAAQRDHTGFLAFDFIADASGTVYAIECNPRATSGIHFVEPGALAGILTGLETGADIYRDDRLLAESWSCFTACLGHIGRPPAFRDAFTRLRRATDVTWSRRDPLPFLLMPVNTFGIIRDALVSGATFAEVAVRDVEWRDLASDETGA